MPRPWPLPEPSRTVHVIGDSHFGAVDTRRMDKVISDLSTGSVPTPAARVHIGDVTQNGASGEDTPALAFLAALPGTAPKYVIAGNHDLWNTANAQTARSRAQFATAYGQAERISVDLGFARLLALSVPSMPTTLWKLEQADLDWLTAELAAAGKDCWVFHHYPLANTVLGPTTGPNAVWSSAESSFYVRGPNGTDDSEVRAVLAGSPNAKAYISGHTHSPIDVPGFASSLALGGKAVAQINASSPYYIGRVREDHSDPIRTVFLTALDNPRRIEVRFRNHDARCWDALPGGSRVATVTL